jgi:hypothetical protein
MHHEPVTQQPTPPPGGFDDHHDRDPATPPGHAAWGEWVYSHDRAVRCCLTRSDHDELYLYSEQHPEFKGLYGTASEPTVMLWLEVASWSPEASQYDLMSPDEAIAMYADDDDDDELGAESEPLEYGEAAEPWAPPDYVSFGGDRPACMTHLTPDEVDGARRYNLLGHLVWRFSAESAKDDIFDEKAVFGDTPWVAFTPDPLNEPIIYRRPS